MSFESYFRLSSYGFIASAFGALALTGELDGVSVLLYLAAIALAFYSDQRKVDRLRISERSWRLLAILYIPFFFIDAAVISPKRVIALVHLTLFASAAKLFQEKADRDWVFLYLIAFFQMLLAAGLTFDATFFGALFTFTFFFVSSLAALEIRRTKREAPCATDESITNAPRRSWNRRKRDGSTTRPAESSSVRHLVGASVAQLIAVGILTLPLFFLIPRFGGSGLVKGSGGFDAFAGFSKTVSLGHVARIKENSQIVMRVKLDRPTTRWLRWRGIALDRFSGLAWAATTPSFEMRKERHLSGQGWTADDGYMRTFSLEGADGRQRGGKGQPQNLLRQDIVLEPIGVETLFAAHRLVQMSAPLARLLVQESGSVSRDNLSKRISYSVVSDISIPPEPELRVPDSELEPYSDAIKRWYLQIPTTGLDPRIRQLALDVTRSSPSVLEKARAIEGYLKTNYGYTLDLRPTSADPVAEFLFGIRQGHCEYFATAMVLMLRSIGIPARIVNGFQMGEYNAINGVYTVRQRDAHSWVEVYFSNNDLWIEFDPTPADGLNDYSEGGWIANLKRYLDAAELFWMDYVVTLSSDQQAAIMVGLQERLLSAKKRMTGLYLGLKNWLTRNTASLLSEDRWSSRQILIAVLIPGLLVLATIAGCLVFYNFKRRHPFGSAYVAWWQRLLAVFTSQPHFLRIGDRRVSAILFYERMSAIVARAGMIRPEHQTPAEFAETCNLREVKELTEIYNRVRFGGGRLDSQAAERVAALLVHLKRTVKRVSR